MNRYKIAGLLFAAAAAAACFLSYFVGGPDTYGAALLFAAVAFFAVGLAELFDAAQKRRNDGGSIKSRAGGVLSYMKPALFFVVSVLTLFAAAVFFLTQNS